MDAGSGAGLMIGRSSALVEFPAFFYDTLSAIFRDEH